MSVSIRRARLRGGIAAVLALGLIASGCSSTNDDTYSPPTSPPTDEPSINLPEAKASAQIDTCPTSGDQPAVSGGLPDLTLSCLGGGPSVRLAGLRGKPMLVNIWAQWCGPCRSEAPHLADVADLAGDKLMIIGIDYHDPQPGYAIQFAQLAGWHYPQLADIDGSINKTLPFPGPPQTYLVDADGKIVFHQSGQLASTDQLKNLIHDHLGVTL